MASPAQPGTPYFLGTSRSDGRPHAAGVGALWQDGDLYFTSGPRTRKARDLAHTVVGVATAEPYGATRWRFEP